jgi:hypothetical protein
MISAHSAAEECYRRTMLPEQSPELRRDNVVMASKLSRTYCMLLEALNHHRGKGQQKVVVEHVHAHAQAVVGVVEPSREAVREIKGTPHGLSLLSHAGEPALRGVQSPDRPTVPECSDGERAVPDARRGDAKG